MCDVPSIAVFCSESIELLTAIGLSPGGGGYFTCIQNMKFVINKFKSGGLHEKQLGILGTISAFAYRHRETKNRYREAKYRHRD